MATPYAVLSPIACYPCPAFASGSPVGHGWILPNNPSAPGVIFPVPANPVHRGLPPLTTAIPVRWGKSRGFVGCTRPNLG